MAEPYSRAPTQAELEFLRTYGMVPTDAAAFAELMRLLTPAGREGHPAHTVWFWAELGMFHTCWSTADLLMDYAVCKFLNIEPEDGHLITAGMTFGRKAKLVAKLVGRSDHPNRAELLRCINGIRGDIKRDIIMHGYMASEDDGRISFLDRNSGGDAKSKAHTFTKWEFGEHTRLLFNLANDFSYALELSPQDVLAFSQAAFSRSLSSGSNSASPASDE